MAKSKNVNITPNKDFKFNGGGFTGMFWKGKSVTVNKALADYLIKKNLAEFSKNKLKED